MIIEYFLHARALHFELLDVFIINAQILYDKRMFKTRKFHRMSIDFFLYFFSGLYKRKQNDWLNERMFV